MGLKKGDLPVTERTAERLLSLPMFAELSSEQIQYVADSIREYVDKHDGDIKRNHSSKLAFPLWERRLSSAKAGDSSRDDRG